jgi:hypothetical protein
VIIIIKQQGEEFSLSTVEKLNDFEHEYMEFVKGGLDEKLFYDRYSTPEHDIHKMDVGDVVVCKLDRTTDKRIIGTIIDKSDIENVIIELVLFYIVHRRINETHHQIPITGYALCLLSL